MLSFTGGWEASLSTGYTGISVVPSIITDCAPLAVVAQLNTSFIGRGTTNQPDVTFQTYYKDTHNLKSQS